MECWIQIYLTHLLRQGQGLKTGWYAFCLLEIHFKRLADPSPDWLQKCCVDIICQCNQEVGSHALEEFLFQAVVLFQKLENTHKHAQAPIYTRVNKNHLHQNLINSKTQKNVQCLTLSMLYIYQILNVDEKKMPDLVSMSHWWSLCILYLPACYERVIVGNSCLCCCVHVTSCKC